MKKSSLFSAAREGTPKVISATFQRSSLSLNFSSMIVRDKKVQFPRALRQKYKITNQQLGEGSFAKVFYGIERETKKPVAIKVLEKANANEMEINGIKNEIECLGQLDHENIVKMFDSYEDDNRIIVVMEYISGETLYDRITNPTNSFTEQDVKEIILDLTAALKHCNERGVIHRDVKPKNIMYASDDEGSSLKLIDFNLSTICDPSEIENIELEEGCGTAKYVAPEIANGDEYGYNIDIWSLGVVAYVCTSGGYLPFSSSENTSAEMSCILDKVEDGEWLFEPKHAWSGVSASLKDLISGMLSYEPENRMKYEEILKHEFIAVDDGEVHPINISDFKKNLVASTTRMQRKKKKATRAGIGIGSFGGSFLRLFKF